MNISTRLSLIALMACLSLPAQAHRSWMLPSATILAGDTPWITVDAAVSNDIFYFEHFPLQIEGVGEPLVRMGADGKPMPQRPRAKLQVLRPDGSSAEPKYGNTGRYRSTFDVELDQKGTWKLAIANQGLFASYQLDGERKRVSGTEAEIKKALPKKAENLEVISNTSRMEVFVTAGAPTDELLMPTGKGLELLPQTHPNDLVQGETARFVFVLDGQPAAGVKVTLIPEGIRYRDNLEESELVTNAQGEIQIDWPRPGMYWLQATSNRAVTDPKSFATQRRDSYTATLEVMAP